ncbi:MAG: SWIM zinc finger family protein [Ardenticatenaceae bacterium]
MIDSGMIHKIHKAKEYAAQPERIKFKSFTVQFDGVNDGHKVEFNNDDWSCDCRYFGGQGFCSHTMAMERVLGVMIPTPQSA